jgi:L-gulonolactone oxidase
MVTWSNWSGRHHCEPASLRFARSVPDIQAAVAATAAAGQRIRVAGAGHSHYPLVPTDGVILDLSGLAGVVDVDRAAGVARVWSGTVIAALGRPLHDAGVALSNQGDIDRQSIGGAVATGTHGTGLTLQSLSASVVGATIVTADGELVTCAADHETDLFAAARLGLGALGVVTTVDLAVRDEYRLAEHGWTSPYDEVRQAVEDLPRRHRHFEFFWYPRRDVAAVKTIDETEDEPRYPLGEEGSRCAWSYEVLPNHRPVRHTEMEYAVPLEVAPRCLDDIRSLILASFPELRWPVEYRTLAADDVWLSPAYGRDVATISVHEGVELDDEPLFRACEEVFLDYDGRPHWGKVHHLDGDALARLHPRWDDWWAQRDRIDPDGAFLNAALQHLR